MLKLMLPVIGFCLVAVYGVQEYVKHAENTTASDTTQSAPQQIKAASAPVEPEQKSEPALIGKKAKLKMDSRGHFVANARMNGRTVEVLVDTGATSVAINKSTARRLGIRLQKSDFKYTVNTANGQTSAASAMIEKIQIGRVIVRDVRAAVLEDEALSGTLLGMSFLGQLKSFEVRNNELLLVQ